MGALIAIWVAETLFLSYLIQATPADSLTGLPQILRTTQHWLFRFLIAYLVSVAILGYLRRSQGAVPVRTTAVAGRVRLRWWAAHALLLVPLAVLSRNLYSPGTAFAFVALAVAWHITALGAVGTSLAAMAPLKEWSGAFRSVAPLFLYALIPGVVAVLLVPISQMLWSPVAKLTFRIVLAILHPLRPSLQADAATLTIATNHFAIMIADVCSGLEGIGLMLAFCTAWLWYFRREYYFPRALLIIPGAVALVFLLNALRIVALVLIGDAGYQQVAIVGFHSQAGWIAFNLAAFGVAVVAGRSPWLNRSARQPVGTADNSTAAYLMPLLVILAVGMLGRSLSAGFDVFYPLRLAGGAVALWLYRRSYRDLNWTFSWRAPLAGGLVFCIWIVAASKAAPGVAHEPDGLEALPTAMRDLWILCRILSACMVIPIVEELAYRGYLMRRVASADFVSVACRDVRWLALIVSAVAFGAAHGSLWLPGIVAGLVYGILVIRTGKIGEAVVAHATSNALLALYVLRWGQWQLW